jgi:hypothetical protein
MPPFISQTANLIFNLCKPGGTVPDDNVSENLNITNFLDFATKNGVGPWCYYKLNECPDKALQWPSELKASLRMQYLQTLVMNQQKWKVYKEMNTLAKTHEIPIIPLKGTAIAFTLYPQEALRPMGDIDILVPEEKIYKFRDIMIQHNAEPLYVPLSRIHNQVHAHIAPLKWQNIMIEPHQRLYAIGSRLNLKNLNLFNHLKTTEAHPDIKIFNDVMQTYHLATHAFKSYKLGGMRLGWLLDIALILQKNQNEPDFKQKIIALNPKAKKDVTAVLQWASLLISDEVNSNTFTIPFPEEEMFHRELNPRKRHRFIVLNEIAHLPGIQNKFLMLFREFFPEKKYMDYQYGKHRGMALMKLYLKRIAGSPTSPTNN